MKYLPSIAFEEMSGSAKGVTAAKTRGRKYIRNRGYGGSVRTSDQASVKSVFKMLSQAWQSLTGAQIQAWNNAAQSADAKSVLGTKTRISGANLFMRLNYWVVTCGGDILQTPPVLGGVEAPAAATIALSGTAFTLTLASVPEDVSNLKLIICASAPQSNGISNAYAKAAEFITPQTPVTTAIALKTSYDAKYGAPSSGSPKVFIKYFYVNTATGQKSGEMLAVASLASSNEQQPGPEEDNNPGGQPEDEFTLHIATENSAYGSVSPAPGDHDYPAGTEVTITATPASGYRFKNWSDSNTDNPRQIVLNTDYDLTASFEYVLADE